jgi:CheY-like chemotaxis protein
MRTFRALVVDDDHDVRTRAEAVASGRDDIDVLTAKDLEEAELALVDGFFNIAFVDLQLDKVATKNVDGQTILNQLLAVRPSCDRLLITVYPDKYRDELFVLLDPQQRIIDGAIDKEDFGNLFADVLIERADAWLRTPFDLTNRDAIFDALARRNLPSSGEIRGRMVEATCEELDYVVSSLFGQGLERGGSEGIGPDDLRNISLDLLPGGKSRSIVAVGRPLDRAGGGGIHCVVKIGPREDTLEEQRRYERYVRYRVSLHRRVELLGCSLGDTMGAVCYSFAGQSPESITDLQGLIDAQDPAVLGHLDRLLGDAGDWYAEDEFGQDLAGFFNNSYELDGRHAVRNARHFAEHHAHRFGARYTEKALVFDEGKVRLPTNADLGAGHLRGRYGARIVHGDLNASNVIVSDVGDLTLIDFRHTKRGPYAIDFAALHASVRLSPPSWTGLTPDAVKLESAEYKLWRHDWTKGPPGRPTAAPPEPYWVQVAARLMWLAFSSLEGLTRIEYASTCMLYALRIFRVATLDPEARLRLLTWISALCRVLDDENGHAE